MNFLEKIKKAIWELENQKLPVDEIIGINSSFSSVRFQFGTCIVQELMMKGWNLCDETSNLAYFKHENYNFEICCDKK
jgi:hypothetical protein